VNERERESESEPGAAFVEWSHVEDKFIGTCRVMLVAAAYTHTFAGGCRKKIGKKVHGCGK